MRARKEFYKEYVDIKVRISMAVFILVFLIMFGIVLYDSFVHGLPFYYVLFFISGTLISFFLKNAHKIYWSNEDQKIMREMGLIGILFLVALILFRTALLPKILMALNLVYVSDAFLLIAMGIFWEKAHSITKQIEEIVFSSFSRKNS